MTLVRMKVLFVVGRSDRTRVGACAMTGATRRGLGADDGLDRER
jgi:hypothetical protein